MISLHIKPLLISGTLLIASIALSGCGGGSSGSENPPSTTSSASSTTSLATSSSSKSSNTSSSVNAGVSTTFKVRVHVPESFPSNDQSGKSTNVQLNANNFALVSVSLSGVVTERYAIKPADIAKTDDSNWTIKAQVAPRLDTVVVADVTKAIDLPTITNIKTDGLLYAPATAEFVDINVASTSAYKNLLAELGGSGTFAEQGIDPASSVNVTAVESLVNTVQIAVPDDYLNTTTNTAAALILADEPAKAVVKQEVVNIKNPAVGTAASLIRDQGGIFWYGAFAGEIDRGALVGTSVETYGLYQDDAFVTKPLPTDEHAIVLSSAGWTPYSDTNKVISYNDNGSVTTQNNTSFNIGETFNVTQAFDLSGRNILAYVQSTTNTAGMTSIVNPTAVFASGSKGYRFAVQAPELIYSVYFEPGDAQGKCWGGDNLASSSGGNCISVDMISGENHSFQHAVSGYSNLFSPDVAINTANYRAILMGAVGPNSLEVQIINDAQKTVKFYESSSGVYNKLIATSTWSEVTLPYLTTDNKAVHFTFPESVFAAATVWTGEDSPEFYVTQQNGYLRGIYTVKPEAANEAVFFNATANASINTAVTDYRNPLVGTWTAGGENLIFSNNNTFTHIKTTTDDPNCQAGSASGTYSWNPLTSILNVSLNADTTATDPTDSCSVANTIKLSLEGNKIVLATDEGDLTFTKSTSSTGLEGTWVYGNADDHGLVLFNSTQYFIADYSEEDGYGTENGTYTYNTGTSEITPTVINDHNSDKGFSDSNNLPFSLTVSNDNDSLTTSDGFVLKRLK